MKRNFDFLKDIPDFARLYEFCKVAESHQLSNPSVSALHSRLALENIVKSIYLIQGWEAGERANLFELVDGEDFKAFINDDRLMMALHHIRKTGNHAAHEGVVSLRDSFFALLNLHNFVGSVLMLLDVIDIFPRFQKELLTEQPGLHIQPGTETAPDPVIETKYSEKLHEDEKLQREPQPEFFSEAETRRIYIDMLLNEAGWEVMTEENMPVPRKAGVEIRVEGMPNNQNVGFVDYVLYGRDGKPLAVVEAKRTGKDPATGKQQATLYAEALERQYACRPVIYYSNGYQTYVIDRLGYPPRRIYGFHTLEELELMQQRQSRSDITDLQVNRDISGRHYQIEAVTAVCEHFNAKQRRALLVMATGTGKTRVSISLVELLMRNNWIKNVLFLADRTALVSQAKKNFVKLLPKATVNVLNENDREHDLNARIIFSTYQTMINYIDSEVKDFSVGRFDLIIIDEAHRSVFGKYGAIFDYFDSLLVGLTATPRADVDRSTYQLFNMEEGIPNFSYELDEAVSDRFLNPYRGIIHHSKHIQRGIKYDELSQDEKEQLEKVWLYESAREALDPRNYRRDIGGNEMFNYIYNDDTIDKVLQNLMSNGLHVQDGERIGKTIIFAYNHRHAVRIVERFHALYPQYGADFCVLIDNTVNYAQSLIERFELRDSDPQIAVSVDMLDTGIDVPDILNLVFFKVVRSKIKFWQMIGRGTRLSEDIFGESRDKEQFLIFDYGGNFDFFGENPQGAETQRAISLTERLFSVKTDIVFELQSHKYQSNDFARGYYRQWVDELRQQVQELNRLRIDVRRQLQFVDKYSTEAAWEYISLVDVLNLKEYIAPLLTAQNEDINAKRFDLLVLVVVLSLLNPETEAMKSKTKIVKIAELLQEKTTIPSVKNKIAVIEELLTENFWENLSMDRLEYIRVELRDLMQFLLGEKGELFTVDIEDEISEGGEAPGIPVVMSYRQRVLEYLAENLRTNEALQKIMQIEKLEREDILELERILWSELGTQEDYKKHVGNRFAGGNVAVFIRSIIGIDKELAMDKFVQFLSDNQLNTRQQEYIRSIINYVCENGDITRETIVNETPFDDYDWVGVFEDQAPYITKYVDELHDAIG